MSRKTAIFIDEFLNTTRYIYYYLNITPAHTL